jgi:type 1 glutamine amidotransferase
MSRARKWLFGVLGFTCLAAAAACDSGAGPKHTQGPAGSSGPAGTTGAAGVTTGSAGAGPAGTSGGAGAPPPPVAAAGAAATGAAAGAPAAAAPAPDAATTSDAAGGAALPRAALIYTRTGTGYRHESIEPGAMAIKAALTPLGITSEISDDLTLFTTAGLARFGVVVLISTSGAAFGTPGTEPIGALVSFVRAGGGVVSIHAATATAYDGTSPYVQLLGGKFIDHPGGIRKTPCFVEGMPHVTTATMPATFMWTDEIYTFRDTNPENQVVVTCTGYNSTMHIPISWYRREGAGRVFNTAMGHGIELYAATGMLLKDHLVPGILWTLGLE